MKKNNKQTEVDGIPKVDETPKAPTFEKLHNKRPVTRREFLASGLIPFSATMFMPSWLNIFAKAGYAQAQQLNCGAASASKMVPFVHLKLDGGPAMMMNYVGRDAGLNLLSSYNLIGGGTGAAMANLTTTEFSNQVPFYSASGMIAGIRSMAQTTTLANSSFVAMPLHSQDDSSMNPFAISGNVAAAGLKGSILPGLGTANTPTGLNATAAYLTPPAPLIVSSFQDIIGSLGVSGSLSLFTQSQQQQLFQLISNLTQTQVNQLAGMNGGATLSQLIQCSDLGNVNLVGNNQNLDINPFQVVNGAVKDAGFSKIWGVTTATSESSQNYVFGTLVYNAIRGNAGTIALDMGGYDYHDNTRTTGDAKDLAAGTVMGQVLESFSYLGSKGFLAVSADGAVSSMQSNTPGAPWASDRGTGGGAYMIAHNPSGPPATSSFQLGQMTQGQVADETFVTGGVVELSMGAVFANYMAFNGGNNGTTYSAIENIIPRVFSDDQKAQIIKFQG